MQGNQGAAGGQGQAGNGPKANWGWYYAQNMDYDFLFDNAIAICNDGLRG